MELKPCPFCGGEADFSNYAGRNIDMIYCKGCAMETDTFNSEKELIEAWNHRVDKVDDLIGDGKPLGDRWRKVLDREYVPKADLRKLLDEMRFSYNFSGEGFSEGYNEAIVEWADKLEELLREMGDV